MPDAVARGRHAVARDRSRARVGLPAGIALSAALLWLAAAPLAGQGSHGQLYLTVLDRNGAPIVDLQPGDVIVTENGVPGEVTHLVRPSAPAEVTLLVDIGQHFVTATPHLRRALRTFVDRLAGSARMSLMTFGGVARNVVASTGRAAPLHEAIDRLFPRHDPASAFHDGIFQITRRIVEQRPRRPIIVVVTSAAASRSPSDLYTRDFLDPLQSVGVPVHVVVLRLGPGDLRGGLAEIARRTGGRFATVANHTRLDAPLAAVAEEILAQYVLTYIRPALPDDTVGITLGFQIAREDVAIRVAPVQ